MNKKTFSIILETENLGMAGLEDLKDTVASLEKQTYPFKEAKEIIIIAAGHVSVDSINLLKQTYPWIKIHKVEKSLEYIESKKLGAQITTGEIVVFIDSDMIYEETWLENILKGFNDAPGATIVAGDTRIRGNSIYSNAIQLIWMMNAEKKCSHIRTANHFDLNNFGIKREIMANAPIFLGLPIYRASTVETRKQLYSLGYSAMRAPNARGYHLPPGNFVDFWYRLLVYGADAVVKADFYFLHGGKVVEKFSPIRRLYRIPLFFLFKIYHMFKRSIVLISENPKRVIKIIPAFLLALIFLILPTMGSIIALFNRDFLFKKVTSRETAHVV